MSNYTTTHSGQHIKFSEKFTPDIKDIAYSLSRICRFNGHTEIFFPVSAHSVLVAELTEAIYGWDSELYRAALLHDAQEAYIGDLASPIKRLPQLSGYVEVENWFANQIKESFGLKYDFLDEMIKKADKVALLLEGTLLLKDNEWARNELEELRSELEKEGKTIKKLDAKDLLPFLSGDVEDIIKESMDLFLNAYDEVSV